MMLQSPLSPAQERERQRRVRGRNWAVLGVMLGLAVLFFAISAAKMAEH